MKKPELKLAGESDDIREVLNISPERSEIIENSIRSSYESIFEESGEIDGGLVLKRVVDICENEEELLFAGWGVASVYAQNME